MNLPARRFESGSAFTEAQTLLDMGMSLIPVDRHTKRSLVPWRLYQTERVENLNDWRGNDAFAVVTGAISSVVVLDVDPGGMVALQGKHLPETPTASTPRGGVHYYYRHPGKPVKTSSNIFGKGSAVDIRGDGGYAVAPNGDDRQWLSGLSPNEVDFADMPDWLRELVCEQPISKQHNSGTRKDMFSCTRLHSTLLESEDAPISLRDIRGDGILKWLSDDRFIDRAKTILGIPNKPIGTSFRCVLPGHDDDKPSASLYRYDSGLIGYRDWHAADGDDWYTLPEVYASQHYGKAIKFTTNKPSLATWSLRLIVETGLVRPAQVELPELPPHASKNAHKLRDGFRLLVGCRWLYLPGNPTSFAHRFAGAWSGVPKNRVGDGIGELLKHGVIQHTGHHGKGGMRTNLFLPGSLD